MKIVNKLALILFILLAGCASKPTPLPPVKVITTTVPIEIYSPPSPQPIQLDGVTWFVITPENFAEQLNKVEQLQGKGNFVMFSLTPQDYENIAHNFQEMRRYILQQKEINDYYREATAPLAPEEWANNNNEDMEKE